jgi:hypothetical protein
MRAPRWLRNAARLVGSVMIGGSVVLLATVAILGEAETVMVHVPWLSRPIPMLVFILLGLAVLRFGSSDPRSDAAIRAYLVRDGSKARIALKNIGGHEAVAVQVSDITTEGYAWKAEFREVGSIPSLEQRDEVVASMVKTGETCTIGGSCVNYPFDLNQFFQEAAFHRVMHAPAYKERYGLPLTDDERSLRDAMQQGRTVDMQGPLKVTFTDHVTGERWECLFRLHYPSSGRGKADMVFLSTARVRES